MSGVLAPIAGRQSVERVWAAIRSGLMSVAESILDRVERKDAGADAALVERYGPLVWSLARRFCRDRSEAEDAV